mgnify:CR=1 FL=1
MTHDRATDVIVVRWLDGGDDRRGGDLDAAHELARSHGLRFSHLGSDGVTHWFHPASM